MNKKIFYLSSDHAGYKLKEEIKSYLNSINFEVIDLGTNNENKSVSYALYGKKLAKNILNNKNSYGIGVCGTGIGISCSVNRFKGIRGAKINTIKDAELAKKHNDANILLFGGRQLKIEKVKKMIDKFIKTQYENGRHQYRIDELDK